MAETEEGRSPGRERFEPGLDLDDLEVVEEYEVVPAGSAGLDEFLNPAGYVSIRNPPAGSHAARVLRKSRAQKLVDRYLSVGLSGEPILRLLEADGQLEGWRAHPICLVCGCAGDREVDAFGEYGALCTLHAPTHLRKNPSTLEFVLNQWRARLEARPHGGGRPPGTTRRDPGFPADRAAAIQRLQERSIDLTEKAIAREQGLSVSTARRQRKAHQIPRVVAELYA